MTLTTDTEGKIVDRFGVDFSYLHHVKRCHYRLVNLTKVLHGEVIYTTRHDMNEEMERWRKAYPDDRFAVFVVEGSKDKIYPPEQRLGYGIPAKDDVSKG